MADRIYNTPAFSLDEVKEKIRARKYVITGKALVDAKKWFEWGEREICECLLKLEKKHFKKSMLYRARVPLRTDYYEAKRIHEGEDIFTHFCIDDNGILEITSFKQKDAM